MGAVLGQWLPPHGAHQVPPILWKAPGQDHASRCHAGIAHVSARFFDAHVSSVLGAGPGGRVD